MYKQSYMYESNFNTSDHGDGTRIKEGEKSKFQGRKVNKCARNQQKFVLFGHFYAEIVKVGLILTHMKLWGKGEGGQDFPAKHINLFPLIDSSVCRCKKLEVTACIQTCINCVVYVKVGVNPSLKREMWLLMDLITKKTCKKMYKSIHFWNQKNLMNPMVATDFCKIMRFSRNSSLTMVTIEFFLDSITKIWFY